jgi:hypothetical protein
MKKIFFVTYSKEIFYIAVYLAENIYYKKCRFFPIIVCILL